MNRSRWLKLKPILFLLMWLFLLGLAIAWRLKNIDAFGLTNDEGAYLMWARLASEGYPLYAETYANAPPFFLEQLALIFRGIGFNITLGRLVVLFWFVALNGLLGWLGYRSGGWIGAYAALLVTAFIPLLFSLSRQVMLEVPAMALAVATASCGLLFFEGQTLWGRDCRWWLAMAGAALGGSLMVKLLHPLAAVPVLYFIWHGATTYKARFRSGLWFGLALLATIALIVSFYDLPAFLDQVIFFRAGTWETGSLPLASNGSRLLDFGFSLWGVSLLVVAGFVAVWQQAGQVRGRAWSLWLLANMLLVLWYQPLFPHHFSILIPPAILLAIEFVAVCRSVPAYRWGWVLALAALLNVPQWIQANRATTGMTTGGREAEAARILAQVTHPDDFVMADSQLLALLAGRRAPPPLLDFSLVTIKSGRQSAARLVDLSETYQVAAVAPWALRMAWLPAYLDWAEARFWVHKVWDDDHQLFFGPKHPEGQPIPNEQQVQLEGGPVFLGYRLETKPARPGEALSLTLYWRTDDPLPDDYTMFVHVLNTEGRLVAQHDGQPIYGYFPTSRWPTGEVIPDRIAIPLPEDLPPGRYSLIAGMYTWPSLNRLNVADGGTDFIPLTSISVDAPH
jgi:hypothetical protein